MPLGVPVQTPALQASPSVLASPSLQGVPSGVTGFEQVALSGSQTPASWHWSWAVQTTGLTAVHVPPWQVSLCVQASPSLQLVPVSGVTVQLDVPLQVRVLHWSEVQVIAVPTHWPLPSQVSLKEQASPSSQLVPLSGVTVQLDVPLQVRVLHWSEVQVIAVPTHWPLPSQVSLKEQASPSSQRVPVGGETVQVAVPLQAGVLHGSAVQVTAASQDSVVQAFWSSQSAAVEQSVQPAMGVPSHCPLPSQTSLKVHALPSSHGVSVGWKTSGGQYTLVPVQVSATSHAPAAALQTVPVLAGG